MRKPFSVFLCIFLVILFIILFVRNFAPTDQTRRSYSPTYSPVTSTPRPVPTSTVTPRPTDTPAPVFDYTFIAHAKSKIFHNPLCPTARIISDPNREYFTCSRDDLISAGYHPCPSCHGEAYTVARVQATAAPLSTSAPRPTATPNEAWARFLAAIAAPSSTSQRRATARPTATPASMHSYVGNANTRVFHFPSCPSAKQIKDANRREYYCTRQEMLAKGYRPCERCFP